MLVSSQAFFELYVFIRLINKRIPFVNDYSLLIKLNYSIPIDFSELFSNEISFEIQIRVVRNFLDFLFPLLNVLCCSCLSIFLCFIFDILKLLENVFDFKIDAINFLKNFAVLNIDHFDLLDFWVES